ncbi:MAG: (2Fe-2S) ferredoxin domain-containing protein [Cytophagaceae bacterium]|jgi:(2Fe-2S) ferredoxin|nr:(2Fe-2S) ferredoxin domain-containing protein [Cytophagaceae bacterium]
MKYVKHVFICTNQKPEGKKCCGEAHGMALVEAFKKEIKDRGLHIDIRAQRAGCLDVCGQGPALVVYPEGIFYGNVQLSDVVEIVEQHLIHNQPVTRLKLPF